MLDDWSSEREGIARPAALGDLSGQLHARGTDLRGRASTNEPQVGKPRGRQTLSPKRPPPRDQRAGLSREDGPPVGLVTDRGCGGQDQRPSAVHISAASTTRDVGEEVEAPPS